MPLETLLAPLPHDKVESMVGEISEMAGLSLTEQGIIAVLLPEYPAVQTREQLLSAVWKIELKSWEKPGSYPLRMGMHRLNAKLERAGAPYSAQSLRGFGYWLQAKTPEGLERLARLAKTPLHYARAPMELGQILLLNGIELKFQPSSIMIFFELLKTGGLGKVSDAKEGVKYFLNEEISENNLDVMIRTRIKSIRAAIDKRQVNGYSYEIWNRYGKGYFLQITPTSSSSALQVPQGIPA